MSIWDESKVNRDEQGRFAESEQHSGNNMDIANYEASYAMGLIRGKTKQLPRAEYAQLVSTIRTKYGNNIPTKGGVHLANHYYWCTYSERTALIRCRMKLPIVGNEQEINFLEKLTAWKR